MKDIIPRIECLNLNFGYPSVAKRMSIFKASSSNRTLKDINLTIFGQQSMGIVGPNGAGKTTLLRLLAGIYSPDQGKVVTNGKLTTMFDAGFGLDLESNGESNVKLRGLLLGRSKLEIEKAASEIQEFVALGDKWLEPLRTYSSGMISRIVVGLATSFHSEILLMDEGIGASDISFQKKANAKFKKMLKHTGTIVMASHNQALMEEFCTRACLLVDGQITEEGNVREVWQQYIRFSKRK